MISQRESFEIWLEIAGERKQVYAFVINAFDKSQCRGYVHKGITLIVPKSKKKEDLINDQNKP